MKKLITLSLILGTTGVFFAKGEQPKQNEKSSETKIKIEKTLKEDSNFKSKKTIISIGHEENEVSPPDTTHCWLISIPIGLGGPTWSGCGIID